VSHIQCRVIARYYYHSFKLVLGRNNSKFSGRHLPKITSCDLGTKPSYIIQICFTPKIKVNFTQSATLLYPEEFVSYFSIEIFYSLLLTGFEQLLRFPNSYFQTIVLISALQSLFFLIYYTTYSCFRPIY